MKQNVLFAPVRGFRRALTLLETSVVLLIAVAALAAGAVFYSDYLKNQANRVAAQQLTDVTKAFNKYIEDNFAQVLTQAGPTGVTEISIDDLKPEYLSQQFPAINAFGQSYVFAARKPIATQNNLEAVVYTRGGEEIEPDRALTISQMVGATGGFTLRGGNQYQVRATFDGYDLNLSDYNASPGGTGKLVSALFLNELGAITSDYLYRNRVPGRPELNTMNTDLNMGAHAIANAGQVTAAGVTTTNDISAGGVLRGSSVNSGTDVVANQDVIATRDARVGRNLAVSSNISAGGAISASGQVRGNNVYSDTTVTAAGAITSSSTVQGSTIVPTLVVVENTSCGGYAAGTLARTGAGQSVSCDSGIWKSGGGVLTVSGSTCPAGYSPVSYYFRGGQNYTWMWSGSPFYTLCTGPGGDAGTNCGIVEGSPTQVKCVM